MARRKTQQSDPMADVAIAFLHYGAVAGLAYVLLTLAARGLYSVLGPTGVKGVLLGFGLVLATWVGFRIRRRLQAHERERACGRCQVG